MVTTFNDRVRGLQRTVAPLVGKPSALLSNDALSKNMSTSSRGIKRQAPHPSTTFGKRASPPFYYTKSTRYMSAADAERRRKTDELHYTASTIQQALEDANRPPVSLFTRRVRALPSSVNTDSCTVITSAEYAESSAQANEHPIKANANENGALAGKENSVDEMLLYAALIQSTRQFYGFAEDTSPTTNGTTTNNNEQQDGGVNDDDDDGDEDGEEEELRASSDATSTWSPTLPCNQVNLNDKKAIDNDNRSDETSSNPSSGEESSDVSFSDQCEGAGSSSSPIISEKGNSNSGDLLENGNIDIGNDDVNNDANNNIRNDGARDDNRVRRNSDTDAAYPGSAFFVCG